MSAWRAARFSSDQSVAPGMTDSDHSKKRSQSSSGIPSSVLMMKRGNGTETDSTKSIVLPAAIRSTSGFARRRTSSSSARMRPGAKPGCTSLRYTACSGGSVCIIVGGVT